MRYINVPLRALWRYTNAVIIIIIIITYLLTYLLAIV